MGWHVGRARDEVVHHAGIRNFDLFGTLELAVAIDDVIDEVGIHRAVAEGDALIGIRVELRVSGHDVRPECAHPFALECAVKVPYADGVEGQRIAGLQRCGTFRRGDGLGWTAQRNQTACSVCVYVRQ